MRQWTIEMRDLPHGEILSTQHSLLITNHLGIHHSLLGHWSLVSRRSPLYSLAFQRLELKTKIQKDTHEHKIRQMDPPDGHRVQDD